MFKHWESGILGEGVDGKGILPAIRDIESRFGPNVAGKKNYWVGGADTKVRLLLSLVLSILRETDTSAIDSSTLCQHQGSR